MTQKKTNNAKSGVEPSQNAFPQNKELAIGSILVAVVLVLLMVIGIVSTTPPVPGELGPVGVLEKLSPRQAAPGPVTLQDAINKAL